MTKEDIIKDVASRLGVRWEYLDALINFETMGTYDPFIKNPYSSARGLIQLTNAPAFDLFNMDSLAVVTKYSDFESQMNNVVFRYLRQYMPFPTKQSLYMAVFYPAFRYVPENTVFPESIQKVNRGIKTVRDYIDYVDSRILRNKVISKSLPLSLILAVMGGVWYLTRKR